MNVGLTEFKKYKIENNFNLTNIFQTFICLQLSAPLSKKWIYDWKGFWETSLQTKTKVSFYDLALKPNERKTDAQNLKTAAISQWKCSHDNVAHVSKGILSFRTHSRFVSKFSRFAPSSSTHGHWFCLCLYLQCIRLSPFTMLTVPCCHVMFQRWGERSWTSYVT